MWSEWVILHGGALGDLVLTLQLGLRLPGVTGVSALRLVSRIDPGDLSDCQPSTRRVSSEGIGLHWLYADGDDSPPERLRELVAGRCVLNALGGVGSVVHRRLRMLEARAVFSLDPRPKPGLDTHITTQWQHELEGQGLLFPKGARRSRESTQLTAPDELRERGREMLANARVGGQPILIHPGSGGRAKCWPLRCFLDVGRRLREQGSEVCFLVGPVEVERWSDAELEDIRAGFPLIQSPQPDELLSLVAAARALISNDAGPAHLAALVGTPTVTVFGSTSAAVWQPLGMGIHVVQGDPEAYPDDWGVDPVVVVQSIPHP